MSKRKFILILFLQVIFVAATSQEYWNGTKTATSNIYRSGQTGLGSLNFRSSGTGTTTVLEHIGTTGELYIRSVSSPTNGDVGNLILNDACRNVGIGTSSPRLKLHIAEVNLSNVHKAPIILSHYWLDDNNMRASAIFHYSTGVKNKLVFAVSGLGGTNTTPADLSQAKMVVQANGHIGIGTTDPQHRLSVIGVVQATEINVTTIDWRDYMFDKEYRLPELMEVAAQIKSTGHLPEMPSAASLEYEGVDLGMMLEMQQKKIEELTLYQIERQKQISQLSRLTDKLQNMSNEKN
jgi:hypothetical protein